MGLLLCELSEEEADLYDNLRGIDYTPEGALIYIEGLRKASQNGLSQVTVPASASVTLLQDAPMSPHLDSLEGLVFDSSVSVTSLADTYGNEDAPTEVPANEPADPPAGSTSPQRTQSLPPRVLIERLNGLADGTAPENVPAELTEFWNANRKGKAKASLMDDDDGTQDLLEQFCDLWRVKVAAPISSEGTALRKEPVLRSSVDLLGEDDATSAELSHHSEASNLSSVAPDAPKLPLTIPVSPRSSSGVRGVLNVTAACWSKSTAIHVHDFVLCIHNFVRIYSHAPYTLRRSPFPFCDADGPAFRRRCRV